MTNTLLKSRIKVIYKYKMESLSMSKAFVRNLFQNKRLNAIVKKPSASNFIAIASTKANSALKTVIVANASIPYPTKKKEIKS